MTYVCGWFVSFFLFELTAVPFILLEQSFTLLVIVYTCIVALVLLLSLWQGRQLWRCYLAEVRQLKEMPLHVKLGWCVFYLIVLFQMVYAILYWHYDGDDAYYIATAVLTNTFDTMYLRDDIHRIYLSARRQTCLLADASLSGVAVEAERDSTGSRGAHGARMGVAGVYVLCLWPDCQQDFVEPQEL